MSPLQYRPAITLPKFLYWAAIAILVYRLVRMAWRWLSMLVEMRTLPLAGTLFALLISMLPILLWWMLSWNVYRQPKRWGLGVGIVMLASIALDVALLTLVPPYRASPWQASNWLRYGLNVAPTIIGAACCISLRWLYPAAALAGTNVSATPSPA